MFGRLFGRNSGPSGKIREMGFDAEVLLVLRSGEVLFTADSLASMDKGQLNGKVFEVMFESRTGDPYFVYYECEDYYLELMKARARTTGEVVRKMEEWRGTISGKCGLFLVRHMAETFRQDIRADLVSFSHNRIHTNVLAYVKAHQAWYPIQQNEEEPEDATDEKVAEVNSGRSKISEFIPIDEASPQNLSGLRSVPDFNQSRKQDEGIRLFEAGVEAAMRFRSNEAIDLYTQSIAACANPSPYINRAKLFAKRIRHREALNDLLMAQHLDRAQGNQFTTVLSDEITMTKALMTNWENGAREELLRDLRSGDERLVARRIFCSSFEILPKQWEVGLFDDRMVEFQFFNELDDVIRFDDLSIYPEASEFAELYPKEFIEKKILACPDIDDYKKFKFFFDAFLCVYDVPDMVRLRRIILYDVHQKLLERDFGAFHMSLDTESNERIKEAEEFLANRAYSS